MSGQSTQSPVVLCPPVPESSTIEQSARRVIARRSIKLTKLSKLIQNMQVSIDETKLSCSEVADVDYRITQRKRAFVYYGKMLDNFLANVNLRFQRLAKLVSTEQTLLVLIRDCLHAMGVFGGFLKFSIKNCHKLDAQFTLFKTNCEFGFLKDGKVNAALHQDLYESNGKEKTSSEKACPQEKRLLVDDHTFEVELKQYIVRSKPIDPGCVKYMKNFFCDNTISKTMRRWLWRERIGNKLKLNRTLFSTWLARSANVGICPESELIIKVDLIRACNCLYDNEDKVRIFADLNKLIRTFVVQSSH